MMKIFSRKTLNRFLKSRRVDDSLKRTHRYGAEKRTPLMKTYGTTTLALLTIVSGALQPIAAHANAKDVGPQVERMLVSGGEAYVAVRDSLLSNASTTQEIQELANGLHWSDSSWQKDAMIYILQTRMDSPEVFSRLNHLRGINPSVYLKWRRAEPALAREIVKGEYHPAALIELYLKTQHAYPYAERSAYGQRNDDTFIRLRGLEEVALAGAMLAGLAHSQHPAATHVLMDAAKNASTGALQELAISLLGKVRTPLAFATLKEMVADPSLRTARRQAAVLAVGQYRDQAAVQVLGTLLKPDRQKELRRSAIKALGDAGSRSVQAKKTKSRTELRKTVSMMLLQSLALEDDERMLRLLSESISRVAHPSAQEQLSALRLRHGSNTARLKAIDSASRRLERQQSRRR
jgi:hypothetical protein